MAWKAAPAVKAVLSQANARWPNRDKSSDGIIGDAEHASRVSDHNPDKDGVVLAVDLTHDPAHGVDCGAIFAAIAASRDRRVKYAIHNRRIVSATTMPWVVRPYTGSNPHTGHLHISVIKAHADDVGPWPGIAQSMFPDGVVYRFYNRKRGHFYTASKGEASLALGAGYVYEGPAWTVDTALNQPVWRFYNARSGRHFYTASGDERVSLRAKKDWSEEGTAFFCGGSREVVRYRNLLTGAHFWTASPAEAPRWPWVREGTAFYV